MVLGIVKASLEILGIGIGVKKWYYSGLVKKASLIFQIMLSHAFSLADVVCGRVSEYTKGSCSCWRLLFFGRHSFAANFPDDLQTYSIPYKPHLL